MLPRTLSLPYGVEGDDIGLIRGRRRKIPFLTETCRGGQEKFNSITTSSRSLHLGVVNREE